MLTVKFKGQTYPVASIKDAADQWDAFRMASNEGCSKIGNGLTVRDGGKIVAKISYNGRIWAPNGSPMMVQS